MRVRIANLDAFLVATRVEPGTLGHLHAGRPAPPWGEDDDADGYDPEADIDEGR
jgi:hypothetical protein